MHRIKIRKYRFINKSFETQSHFVWDHVQVLFPTSFIRRTKYATAIACLYPSAYAMSLVVIAAHFIYRYFAICRYEIWFNETAIRNSSATKLSIFLSSPIKYYFSLS